MVAAVQQPSIRDVAKTLYPVLRNELISRGIKIDYTVYGFVSPDGVLQNSIYQDDGKWVETTQTPDIYLPAAMERVVKSTKRFIIIIGGRGSGKSISVGDICIGDVRDNGSKIYCLREYQSSIRNSVHSLLKNEAERLDMDGFGVAQHAITYNDKDAFEFAGLNRNVSSIKSAYGFKRYWCEESQSISSESLRELTPTARAKPNKGLPRHSDVAAEMEKDSDVSIIFVANMGSTEDPFSKRFINPFWEHIERDGYYEDDLHLIVRMNYTDNPWFAESGLDEERRWDYENLPRALYDHIWLGKPNDSIDSALVMAEWFDACIDAHIRLGWTIQGKKIAAHDPSDKGPDSKGYVARHGPLVYSIEEKLDGDVNEGGHWAADLALQQGVDAYMWDGDGMGAGLAEQNSKAFNGKKTVLSVFRGSEGVDFPDTIYKAATRAAVQDQRNNSNSFKNKRAQYYFDLRDRIYRTYRWVIHGEYADRDECISFSSDIDLLPKLRAEVCRMPIKPNGSGLNELYSKPDMKTKFKVASPNLADPLMMTMRTKMINTQGPAYIPKPIRAIGRR